MKTLNLNIEVIELFKDIVKFVRIAGILHANEMRKKRLVY